MTKTATAQLLPRLPEALVRTFPPKVPGQQRSAYVSALLAKALAAETEDDDPLYRASLAAEQDSAFTAEMAGWEASPFTTASMTAPAASPSTNPRE